MTIKDLKQYADYSEYKLLDLITAFTDDAEYNYAHYFYYELEPVNYNTIIINMFEYIDFEPTVKTIAITIRGNFKELNDNL